jgi:serine/threonine protein phosphatase PrpC
MTADPLPTLTCSFCGEQVASTASYCESCGTELAAPVAAAAPPVTAAAPPVTAANPPVTAANPPVTAANPPVYATQCPVCSVDPSSSPGAINAEGYCESCGRQVPSGRDHVELDLGMLAGVTDRGLRHPRNEDAMALAAAQAPDGPVVVAVVCDGVSTSPRADEASLAGSQAAVRMLLTSVRRGDDPREASLAAVRQAHLALTSLGSSAQAPSATYISATISGDGVTVCWLGDSRAYWLSSEPVRLTTDDSLAEELVARGDLDEAQAMTTPQAHVITRWLGADVEKPQAHVARFEPPGPGVVLVCSDGLWNYRPDAVGLAQLALPRAFTDPLGAAVDLVNFAIEAGGTDNITAVLVPFPLLAKVVDDPVNKEPG